MSSIQVFSQIWPLIPAAYTLAKVVLGGVQISAFVVSTINDKEHLAALFSDMFNYIQATDTTTRGMAALDLVHGGAIIMLLDANQEAMRVYRLLQKHV